MTGIAERIVITMRVIAKSFAMMLRPPAGLAVRPRQLSSKPPQDCSRGALQTDSTRYFAL
jgi:hypothetical protein